MSPAPGGLVAGPAVALGPVHLARPLVLLALPLALAAVAYLVVRGRDPEAPLAGRRRWLLLGSRLLLVSALVVAAAGPYTVAVEETTADPEVHLLVDRSASMDVFDADVDAIAAGIEAEGVAVRRTTVADGEQSALGDGVIANLERGSTVLLVSDGRTTHGRTLGEAAEVAVESDAAIHAVALEPARTARTVALNGPSTTSVGVENAFLVSVDGVNAEAPVELTVTVDGEVVEERSVTGSTAVEVTHAFETPGDHRVVARLSDAGDGPGTDTARRAVRVVEPPRVLYVSRTTYPLSGALEQLYEVDRAESVPSREALEPYYAVIVQDVAAADLGDVDALHRYAIDGNGVVVVGGDNAYDRGGYAESSIAQLLPVRVGEHGGASDIVLLVDISASAHGSLPVTKSISLDVLDQLGDDNRVGLVAFDAEAHVLHRPTSLATDRARLEDTILRLQSRGGTRLGVGLLAAGDLLDDGGEIILISDGIDRPEEPLAAARRLAAEDVRVSAVGTGGTTNEELLAAVARETGGTYIPADETTRLRLLFGGDDRPFEADRLTIVDDGHFITRGVELTSNPALANEVTPKDGARYLVATADGKPALATWRYGTGRVVSLTVYDGDGSLGPLLSPPDSTLVSKSINWAIGDPERKATDVVAVEDGRVGEPTTVTYRGESRPTLGGLRFARVDEGRYEATVVPEEPGFHTFSGASYAVNPPLEYAALGVDPTLEATVAGTGGRTFDPDETAAMAAQARAAATEEREVRTSWGWLLLVAALLGYLLEVSARRIEEIHNYANT